MILYEVNLIVNQAIAADYRAWLNEHIKEILTLNGFISARLFQNTSEDVADNKKWTVQYLLKDQQALDNYLTEHAPRLRADGIKRFGDQFTATRRVLKLSEEFT